MILVISGKARVGKDTFAKMLAKELQKQTGRAYILTAYAYELKMRVQRDFDLSYEQLFGHEKEVEDKRYRKYTELWYDGSEILVDNPSKEVYWTPREIMQNYGQFFRTIDHDFWVKELFSIIERREYKNVIITDGRHKNEIEAVVDKAGYHIRIEREDKDSVHNEQHISETALDGGHKVDFIVKNYGTLEDLKSTAKTVVMFLLDSEKAFNKFKKEN